MGKHSNRAVAVALAAVCCAVAACEDATNTTGAGTPETVGTLPTDVGAVFAKDGDDPADGGLDSVVGDLGSDAPADGAADVPAADLPPAPGTFGWPCSDNSECASAACLPTAAGKQCSKTCTDSCPKGYACGPVPGSDAVFVCIAKYPKLCDPCKADADCKNTLGGGIQFCVDYGKDGSFCATECKADTDCPGGYFCASETHNGVTAGQCRQQIGLCACSPTAQVAQLQTACKQTSPAGTCAGARFCGKDGLTLCDAPVPSAELCNNKDDDCDGATDEGLGNAPCSNSNANGTCTGTLTCAQGKGACDAPEPATETCNGKDDDCDGQTDEAACNDGNGCTEDACNLGQGGCVFATVTKPCDDGDVCTYEDLCKDGKCGGIGVSCDDGDPCSFDACSATGCTHKPTPAGPCDDNNACTSGDLCGAGSGGKLQCTGVALADGATCSDGTVCTIAAACSGGKCLATQSKCDDANPCTDDGCDALQGGVAACKHFYNAAACDDGNACSLGDGCLGGKCIGLGKLPCDDENPCTADACDAKTGCIHAPKAGAACTDGDVCTVSDACEITATGAGCKGQPLICDDKNPCTADSCDAKSGCTKAAKGGPCEDGDACTKGDYCAGGQCQAGTYGCGECSATSDCAAKEDGNLCNGTLFCEKITHTCQVDPGTVILCPPPIGNGAECVKSQCDAKSGKCAIAPTNDGGDCNDGNGCTSGDACKQGSCLGKYGAAACDDNNPCTQDVCDANKGCTSSPLDGVSCSDGNSCTVSDACAAGLCKPGATLPCDDANPCTSDGCDPKAGCVHNNNTLPCDDGNVCTDGDVCKSAVCTPQKALDCDDNNPCTIDNCNAKTGCAHANNQGIGCNDNNACTSGDKCNGGQCLGAGQLPCSDGNACTDDGCDPKNGCTFAANTLACNDGNSCTDADSCAGGACKSAKPTNCDDANTCTQDLCDPAKGCTYQKLVDGTPCNDGDACTQSDKCANGICLGGPKVGCNDGEPCTTDGCDPKKGCTVAALPDGDPCNDNNNCTIDEACGKGKCTPKGKKDADGDGHLPTSCGGDDCDDNCAACFPGQLEVCDDFDNDCKGGVDDGCDDDNDDWCDSKMQLGKGPANPKTCTKGGGDCEDTKAAINPGATEKLEVDIDHRLATSTPYFHYNPAAGTALKVANDGTQWLATRNQSAALTQNLVLLYAWSREAGNPNWVRAVVDEKNAVGAFALAVDAANVPHIVYQDLTTKAVRHAWRSAQGWMTELIEAKANIGDYVAMSAGPGGLLHAAWYDNGSGDVRYANNDGGKWLAKTVDSQNDVGQFVSIAVSGTGAVHLAYLDYTNQDLRWATDDGSPGTFTAKAVEGQSIAAGFYAALAVDNAGKVHISHYELVGSDLFYTSNASGIWKSEVVDQAGTVGQWTSIATNAAGAVHITYVNVDTGMGRLAIGKPGPWQLSNLVTVGKSTPTAVATWGSELYVAFLSATTGPLQERVRLGTRKGGSFGFEYVDRGAASEWCQGPMVGWTGPRSANLGVGDPAGIGITFGAMAVARWLGQAYEWRLFQAATVLRPGSMAVTQGGDWHACGVVTQSGGYSPKGMGYATGNWATFKPMVTVDAATQALNPCALAMAPDGTAHLTWYDAGNQVMRYATVKGGVASQTEIPDPSFGTGSTQDVALLADGTVVAVYGGKNVRMASRKGNGPWAIETLVAEAAADVALAVDGAGVRHVLYRKNVPSGGSDLLMYMALQGGAWSKPLQVAQGGNTAYATGLGLTVDGNGALHALVPAMSLYLTTAFGAWSPTQLSLGSVYNSSHGAAAAVALVGKRVMLAGVSGSCTQETGFLMGLTYQNLVDDNCDGK
ncbi:MAG: putative metal-binding motif-containing protein [Deltaproteobacteria bacterium]|nr:putative metal-binding motif-containing protein [Deltaproteobacteria bacterium]